MNKKLYISKKQIDKNIKEDYNRLLSDYLGISKYCSFYAKQINSQRWDNILKYILNNTLNINKTNRELILNLTRLSIKNYWIYYKIILLSTLLSNYLNQKIW